VIEARVVDAGDIITSGAITSGLDLALWLVERFASPAIACKVEALMEYQRRGTVWRSIRD
jgi:transcriptional regulator GlxA family with amidase domain